MVDAIGGADTEVASKNVCSLTLPILNEFFFAGRINKEAIAPKNFKARQKNRPRYFVPEVHRPVRNVIAITQFS